ncbi:hypothetical protein TL16_g07339 [Triparma laevis f. inornata]|uniref:RNA helicase n=1 Tax=Triparma laevis f. inornata TaxID=1714386 RepID=A0A9W7AZG8_9STRA|nr:hypothetical protein TL16_g07339 [Triparma laevis f. inornata]
MADPSSTPPTFLEFSQTHGLSARLTKSLQRLNYLHPLPVQQTSVPLILSEGKDVLIQSSTGSGKTLGYLIPILQKLIQEVKRLTPRRQTFACRHIFDDHQVEVEECEGVVKMLILLPTRELVEQVAATLKELLYYLTDIIASRTPNSVPSPYPPSAPPPQILLATPSGLLEYTSVLDLKNLTTLVIDEADLMLSHGYAADLNTCKKLLPKILQTILVSATLTSDVSNLKKVMLHKPAIVKVNETKRKGDLKQFYLDVNGEKDKLLVCYVFLKLGVVKGKSIFFVNSTMNAYRLKLFLEQFGIRSGCIGSEMTGRHRGEVVERFNTGGFEVLIAEDEGEESDSDSDCDSEDEDEEEEETMATTTSSSKRNSPSSSQPASSKKSTTTTSSDFGVSRGVDFRGVKFVVNVDLPSSPSAYTHRIGRTARAGASGCALTLIDSTSQTELEMLQNIRTTQDRLPLPKSTDTLTSSATEGSMQPARLEFDLTEIEGFRYRVEDVSRAVTKVAIMETIQTEIKESVLNSERLQEHFAQNPQDRQLLEADKMRSNVNKVQGHLKNVPNYLIPKGMKVHKQSKKRRRRNNGGSGEKGSNDPLTNFGEKKEGEEGEKRIFLNSDDGTGKSTSGRKAWKMARGKGKFSKRYDATKFRGKR